MDTFKVKTSSWVLFIIFFVALLFTAIIPLGFLLPKGNNAVIYIKAGLSVIIAWTGAYQLSTARTIWRLTTDGIDITWSTQFLLHDRKDRFVLWDEVVSYKYQPDRNFDLLKLKLKDGSVIRIWHDSITSDDFHKLVTAIKNAIEKVNTTSGIPKIKRGKTVYESTLAKVFATVTVILLVALPFFISGLPSVRKTGWIGLGIVYAGGIYFIAQVIAHQKSMTQR